MCAFFLRAQAPTVDRRTKPQHHFMSTGATTTNKFNLKTVWVPAELMVKFLNLAQTNTNKGIETGGFLFGKLVCTLEILVSILSTKKYFLLLCVIIQNSRLNHSSNVHDDIVIPDKQI